MWIGLIFSQGSSRQLPTYQLRAKSSLLPHRLRVCRLAPLWLGRSLSLAFLSVNGPIVSRQRAGLSEPDAA